MFRFLTVEELAEDAFLKSERLRALEIMGTPTDFDERKKAFIELARARVDANDATAKLEAAIRNPSGVVENSRSSLTHPVSPFGPIP